METQAILDLMRRVAAEVIEPRFRALADDEVHEKNPGDLVTVADREAEVLITAELRRAYPEALVLGEEAHAQDPALLSAFIEADHAFTVDPVDGTKNFVNGSPDHAVMVAELRGGEVCRSWIWQPQHQTAYVAELGGGVERNGERLTAPPPVDPPRGATSRRAWVGQELGDLPPLRLTWVCCGVDYPKLVEGAVDFVLYGRGLPWDHAPGSLMLQELGGVLGRTDGHAYSPLVTDGPLLAARDVATFDRVRALL